jgi:hypothetical protein
MDAEIHNQYPIDISMIVEEIVQKSLDVAPNEMHIQPEAITTNQAPEMLENKIVANNTSEFVKESEIHVIADIDPLKETETQKTEIDPLIDGGNIIGKKSDIQSVENNTVGNIAIDCETVRSDTVNEDLAKQDNLDCLRINPKTVEPVTSISYINEFSKETVAKPESVRTKIEFEPNIQKTNPFPEKPINSSNNLQAEISIKLPTVVTIPESVEVFRN